MIKKRKWDFCVLAVVLIVGCLAIAKKQGYHMDELLSFELANAEFTPWIVPTQPEGRLEKFVKNEIYGDSFRETTANVIETVKDVIKNRGASKMLSYRADVYEEPVWISAEQFRDYITTDSRDGFNYLSVYFNVKDDNHPPLHFMALHTVSSLFRGKISPWMGCGINLALVFGICILLMKICREFLEQSEETGCAVCILYACSMAGIATILLIRMYAMLTFFCMAALYLHMKKSADGRWKEHNKLLILVTVCGFLTQYYFVIFMIFLAGVTIVRLWKTEKKELLYYVRTMAVSAVLGLCIFPFSIADVLYSGRGVESVQNFGSLSGYGERLLAFGQILKEQVFGGKMGMAILLLIAAAAFAGFFAFAKQDSQCERNSLFCEGEERKGAVTWQYHMIWIPCAGYFFVVAKIAPYYVDRYLMPVFPLLALLTGIFLQKSFALLQRRLKVFGRKGILLVFAAFLVLPNLYTETPVYLYQGYALQEAMSREYADRACLCVYSGVGYYENLPEFTNYKATLLVTQEELLERSADEMLEEEEELVVLIKEHVEYAAVKEFLTEEYGFSAGKFLMRGTVHGDVLQFFEKDRGGE